MITRRAIVALGALALARPSSVLASEAPAPSFESLANEARVSARSPYRPAPEGGADFLAAMDYDNHGLVRQPLSRALFAGTSDPVTFFPLGGLFRRPVRIFALEGGKAREILYDPGTFDAPEGHPLRDLPGGAGYAGFRVHEAAKASGDEQPDWLAFLGASYFRSAGDGGQYGISARGLAVDTAPLPGKAEDFPDFTRFYVSPADADGITVLAYLDGASATGAFRFRCRRTPRTVMDVQSAVYPRRAIDRLGVAPLTSMYWFSETNKSVSPDWRDECHDSDGLALLTGTGEQIWRPLNNPPRVMVSAFGDRTPRGFGLLQRDRSFDRYRDDVAFQRRPNLWIEPLGDWGPGSVQLVEIPTVREYDDNIVAMWVPGRPAGPGDEFRHAYRMHWSVEEPLPGPAARCIGTRMSLAVETPPRERLPGNAPRERQYVLDFAGPALAGRDPRKAEVVLGLSRGTAIDVGAWPDGDGSTGRWRVFLKVFATGQEPVEARLFLREGADILSETWIGQLHPDQLVAG